MKIKIECLISLLLLLASPCFSAEKPRIFLSVEPVVVEGSTIEPLNAPSSALILVNAGGTHHQNIQLDPGDEPLMYYKLGFRLESPGTLSLKLERFPHESIKEPMPVIEKTISVLDAWRTTLLERTGDGRSIELRVIPVIRGAVDDERFAESRYKMNFHGGPLVLYGESAPEDQVIFREVNIGGLRGLHLGVRGVGEVRLSIDPFKGATECGWVRGHQAYCKLGDASLGIWSNSLILPEDPERPGKGWKLYGELEPDSEIGYLDGFYGGFEP